MSEENVEMVRRIFDAINRRDIDAVVEPATADFVAERRAAGAVLLGVHPSACGARCRVIRNPWR
jgi:ketosteroid isomerase-like protein